MPQDDNQWEINLVKDRYYWLKLSQAQAELIYKFEKDEGELLPSNHYFSYWEEKDYHSDFFKGILNEKQSKTYERWVKKSMKLLEKQLLEGDKKDFFEIQYHQEIVDYYLNRFIPSFSGKPFELLRTALRFQQSKIDFLKAEYKRFLISYKKETIVNHYRHNKTFAPNKLKISLLEHKISCIWPNYLRFKYFMDESTKAVSECLEKGVSNPQKEHVDLVKDALHKMQVFYKKLHKKYHSGYSMGLTYSIPISNEEEIIYILMEVLLFDTNHYGFSGVNTIREK